MATTLLLSSIDSKQIEQMIIAIFQTDADAQTMRWKMKNGNRDAKQSKYHKSENWRCMKRYSVKLNEFCIWFEVVVAGMDNGMKWRIFDYIWMWCWWKREMRVRVPFIQMQCCRGSSPNDCVCQRSFSMWVAAWCFFLLLLVFTSRLDRRRSAGPL